MGRVFDGFEAEATGAAIALDLGLVVEAPFAGSSYALGGRFFRKWQRFFKIVDEVWKRQYLFHCWRI